MNKNRSRKRFRNKKPSSEAHSNRSDKKDNPDSAQSRGRSRNFRRSDGRPNHPPGRSPKRERTIPTSKVAEKYDNLLKEHLGARERYFHLYNRVEGKVDLRGGVQQVQRLKKKRRLYEESLQRLHSFHKQLKPWQMEELQKKVDFFPLDQDFSQAHPEAEIIDQDIVELGSGEDHTHLGIRYHIHEQQQSRPSYKDDTEESEGTMEDYLKYKNL